MQIRTPTDSLCFHKRVFEHTTAIVPFALAIWVWTENQTEVKGSFLNYTCKINLALSPLATGTLHAKELLVHIRLPSLEQGISLAALRPNNIRLTNSVWSYLWLYLLN